MDNQAFDLMMVQIQDLKTMQKSHGDKLDDLLAWKYKLTGIIVTVSTITGVVIQVLINKFFGGK